MPRSVPQQLATREGNPPTVKKAKLPAESLILVITPSLHVHIFCHGSRLEWTSGVQANHTIQPSRKSGTLALLRLTYTRFHDDKIYYYLYLRAHAHATSNDKRMASFQRKRGSLQTNSAMLARHHHTVEHNLFTTHTQHKSDCCHWPRTF